MKIALMTVAAVSLLLPAAVFAQEAPTQDAPAQTAAVKFSLDTPIETIVADEKAKSVLDSDIPGLTAHPSYDQFKGMTLRQLQPFSGGLLTDEMMAKVESDLAVVK
ncbi:MAG: hypothetical protein ACOY45_14780 [Pseudomonadota bacterium]